jgi:hypothetical protein
MISDVTAVLLSWKRKANLPWIIEALRAQTVDVEIWLINNDGFEDFGADRLIAIPWNAGEWARYVVAGRIETPWGMFQDDDFLLGDDTFLEDAISLHMRKCVSNLLGVAGRGLQIEPPHYRPDIVDRDGWAAILKGHFQLFRRETVRRAKIPQHPSASDIYWSLDIGDGEAVHWVSRELSRRLETLERFGVGYEFRPEHYQERDAVCAAWLRERGRL